MDAQRFAERFVQIAQETHEEVKGSLPTEMHALFDASSISGNFCEIWPSVEKEINAASFFARMFAPQLIKYAKILEKVVDEMVVPEVCGDAKTTTSAPQSKKS